MDGIPLFRSKKSEHLHSASLGGHQDTTSTSDIIRQLHRSFPGLGHLTPVTSGISFSADALRDLDVALHHFSNTQHQTPVLLFDNTPRPIVQDFLAPVDLFLPPENTVEIGQNLRNLFNIRGTVTVDYLGTPPAAFPRYLGTVSDYIHDFDMPVSHYTYSVNTQIPEISSERARNMGIYTPPVSSITRFLTALSIDNTLEARQRLLGDRLRDIQDMLRSEFTPFEGMSVATSLTDGSFKWSVPPSSDFASILSRRAPLSTLIANPMKSLNCWEGCLLAGHIAGQLSETDISERFSFYAPDGLNLLMTDPHRIWEDIGFYTQAMPVTAENIQEIPEGHLVYFVPTREGLEVHPTDPGLVKENAFRMARDKIDGALSIGLQQLLIEKAVLSPSGVIITDPGSIDLAGLAHDAIRGLRDARIQHIHSIIEKGAPGPLSFQNAACDIGATQSRELYNALTTDPIALLETPAFLPETAKVTARLQKVLGDAHREAQKYAEIRPFPDHVVISLGDGLCESLWNTPGGIYEFQRVNIATFGVNHAVYAGPPSWLR